MQNLDRFVTPEDVRAAILNVLRTDMFKDQVKAGSHTLMGSIVEAASLRPLIIYDYNRYDLEGSHFTSWMGAIQRREFYENDYIHDLYWMHELCHFATMTYSSDLTFSQWHQKMSENEYQCALRSEAFVYFVLPGLREKTFDFEIWADRFLDGRSGTGTAWEDYLPDGDAFVASVEVTDLLWLARKNGHPNMRSEEVQDVLDNLMKARKQAMRNPKPWDLVEMQISIFAKQNIEWTLTWQNSWRKVESYMEDMYDRHERGEDTSDHIDWLRQNSEGSVKTYGFQLPFAEEAEVFAAVLKDIRDRGGNQILQK